MGWPDSGFLWRENAKPAQKQYVDIAKAISQFEPVVIIANPEVRHQLMCRFCVPMVFVLRGHVCFSSVYACHSACNIVCAPCWQ